MGCRSCFCGFGRPCDHTATVCRDTGSASDSFHRQSLQTLQFAVQWASWLWWRCGGFLRFFRIFRAPPGFPGVERHAN